MHVVEEARRSAQDATINCLEICYSRLKQEPSCCFYSSMAAHCQPNKRPHGDSNAGIHLRRVALYPLSYGGERFYFTSERLNPKIPIAKSQLPNHLTAQLPDLLT